MKKRTGKIRTVIMSAYAGMMAIVLTAAPAFAVTSIKSSTDAAATSISDTAQLAMGGAIIIALVVLGCMYGFGGAETKANVKKHAVGLVIGVGVALSATVLAPTIIGWFS